MSFREPKAPIVRIRKKQVKKKKSKEKDAPVQLPVRASRSTRYSSLTPPTDPQGKGRECCRHLAQSCFRIPICRTICFRCILPPCFSGEGSDDEKDEDIPSERRDSEDAKRTSDVPSSAGGAEGGAGDSIELVEMKSETVALVPPPRIVNEYRLDPCSTHASSSSLREEEQGNKEAQSPTYIEILHVKTETSSETKLSGSKTELKGTDKEMPASDKPLVVRRLSDHELESKSGTSETSTAGCRPKTVVKESVVKTKSNLSTKSENLSTVPYTTDACDAGLDGDDERSEYVNMSILNPDLEDDNNTLSKSHNFDCETKKTNSKEHLNYSNIGIVKRSTVDKPEPDTHDYLNVSSLSDVSVSSETITSSTVLVSSQTSSIKTSSPVVPVSTSKRVYVNVDDYVPKVSSKSETSDDDEKETQVQLKEKDVAKTDGPSVGQNGVSGHTDETRTDEHEEPESSDSVKLLKRTKKENTKREELEERLDGPELDHNGVTDQTSLI